jgi:endonuclease-3
LNPPVASFENHIRLSPFRILISVLLSSRTKDPVTEKASERLFAVADTPETMTGLSEDAIGRLIYPVGFYRQKAKNIGKICRILMATPVFPDTFENLTALPGVGRKTANLVLSLAFARPAIAVDTHVFRISRRLRWAIGRTPLEVETELKERFPVRCWNGINHTLVGFGQTVCRPRNPLCGICMIRGTCPYFQSVEMRK